LVIGEESELGVHCGLNTGNMGSKHGRADGAGKVGCGGDAAILEEEVTDLPAVIKINAYCLENVKNAA